MATLFMRGLKFVRGGFSARKGRHSENRIERQERRRKIDQEIQQARDKVLQQFPW
jgi:hypothetical protein